MNNGSKERQRSTNKTVGGDELRHNLSVKSQWWPVILSCQQAEWEKPPRTTEEKGRHWRPDYRWLFSTLTTQAALGRTVLVSLQLIGPNMFAKRTRLHVCMLPRTRAVPRTGETNENHRKSGRTRSDKTLPSNWDIQPASVTIKKGAIMQKNTFYL